MDQHAFKAQLEADGYAEIESKDLAPKPANAEHGHHFSVRGLVLAGTFIVRHDNRSVTYGPGEVSPLHKAWRIARKSVPTVRASSSDARIKGKPGREFAGSC